MWSGYSELEGERTVAPDCLPVPSRFMLSEGWNDQYNRMRRSLRRLEGFGIPGEEVDSDAARDALYHFFQDAYHLKDWISVSPATKHLDGDLADDFKSSTVLPAVRDIANGAKHLNLTSKSWTKSKVHAEVVGQGVAIRVPAAEAVVDSDGVLKNVGSVGGSTQYSWTVLVDDEERDAIELGQAAVAEWDRWLSAKGLL